MQTCKVIIILFWLQIQPSGQEYTTTYVYMTWPGYIATMIICSTEYSCAHDPQHCTNAHAYYSLLVHVHKSLLIVVTHNIYGLSSIYH